ncbi:uncharacterized protein N7483_009020 [Penicillium malachiteum]|uniref:uncharacterized protein n=1 Tax=Penicillium malachiteum TaxID=1324776 RepID=UPI002546E770|nr:uncharacterized protein N7483_009020 [Penicillium malachiteum]KAJ5721086.1 hypothetical protein N7483_009020 [Penicillium malachiteum]
MTQSHRRSPSHPKSKSSRPVLHRRGTSAVNLSISKLGAGSHCRVQDDEFDMAASFLNFCAMCEKQITVPNNSLLYCSESCRRKDSCKPLSASLPSMSNMSSFSTSNSPPTSPPLSPRTIVAPLTPTRPVPAIRIPTDIHCAKSDLDPTEWKPVILSRTSISLVSSDAWNYLSGFHGGNETLLARRSARSTASLPAMMGAAPAVEHVHAHEHEHEHEHEVHGHGRIPSLTHTPSVSSSFSSTASDELSMYAAKRPLPPRHNPFQHSGTAKGVELVMPMAESHDLPVEVVDSDVWEDAPVSKTAPISMVRAAGPRV